jgi:hypothetical protein
MTALASVSTHVIVLPSGKSKWSALDPAPTVLEPVQLRFTVKMAGTYPTSNASARRQALTEQLRKGSPSERASAAQE